MHVISLQYNLHRRKKGEDPPQVSSQAGHFLSLFPTGQISSCSLAGAALGRGECYLKGSVAALSHHLVCMLNVQTFFRGQKSLPQKKGGKLRGVLPCWRSLQKLNIQRKLHLLHTPSHPVWLSPCGGHEKLSGSSFSRLYKVVPGSTQLPAGLLHSSHHRVNVLIHMHLHFSQEVLTLWSCIRFPRQMSCYTKETTQSHICGYSPWAAAVFLIIIKVHFCHLKWQVKPAGCDRWPQNHFCPWRQPSPAWSPSKEYGANTMEKSKCWYTLCCHTGVRAGFS